MIAVIDTGVANISSVMAALTRLGSRASVTAEHEEISSASHVIFPGVGAANAAMARLRASGLDHLIVKLTQPVLGICLGMQLLFEKSEEGETDGLGVLAGQVMKMKTAKDCTIPHMGWNSLDLVQKDHPLFEQIDSGAYVYFVHSYAVLPSVVTLATTSHAASFTAVAGRANFFGAQFHPERSGIAGAQFLRNFLRL
ncbi:MAG: imidazole glycerol phosphate synthase subunit HisH [Pseudomonadota bacterium]